MVLHVLARRLALQNPCRTGEEPDLVDHRRDLFGHRDVVGLAGVAALGLHQVCGILLDVVGEVEQRLLPVRRGGALPVGERRDAAAYALSMSCSLDIGAVPYSSPVAGSTSGIVAPLTESTSSPSMKFCTVVMNPLLFLEVGEDQGQYVEAFGEQVVADGQRRQEAQDVAERAAGQHDHTLRHAPRGQLLR